MKKIIFLVSLILIFTFGGVCFADTVTEDYTQGLGDFEEASLGSLTSSCLFEKVSGFTQIVEGEENPMNSGKALKIANIADDGTFSSGEVRLKPKKLLDMAKGTEYTKMRVLEFDFYLDGTYTGNSASLAGGIFSSKILTNNEQFELGMYGGSSGATGVVTYLNLREKHNIKLIYELMDAGSADYVSSHKARSLALFIDGKAFTSGQVGGWLASSHNHNPLYDSLAGKTDPETGEVRKNYGRETSTLVGDQYAFKFYARSGCNTVIYLDNVKYYGVKSFSFIADGGGDYSSENEIFSANTLLENDLHVRFSLKAQDAKVFAAIYNQEGKLISLEKTEETADEEKIYYYKKELGKDEGTYTVKMFSWSDLSGLKPIYCEEEIEFTASEDKKDAVSVVYKTLLKDMENNSISSSTIDGYLEKFVTDTEYSEYSDEYAADGFTGVGYFNDIDYSNTSLASWKPVAHLERLKTIAAVYHSSRHSLSGDARLKDAIIKGLTFWNTNSWDWRNDKPSTRTDIHSGNWWYNDRNVPELLADILFFKTEGLESDVLAELTERAMVRYFKEVQGSSALRYYSYTGQGVPDRLNHSIKLAFVKYDDENDIFGEIVKFFRAMDYELTLKTYANSINNKLLTDEQGEAIHVNDTQSIKADYSYQEHTNLLLTGSYGREFVNSTANFLEKFEGTRFNLSEEAAEELSRVLLDGFRWARFNGYMDATTTGRAYGSKGSSLQVSISMNQLYNYLLDNFENAEFAKDVKAELSRTENFSGNRHFWLSDYTVHNRSGYHFSVRSASSRNKTSEHANGQGYMSRYQGDGMISINTRGPEYSALGAVLDWNKLPGTTTDQSMQNKTNGSVTGLFPDESYGKTSFVGGVSDGMYGFHVFDYNRDGVEAKKSWFMFDDEILALGAGITSQSTGEIYTSINQQMLGGEVTASIGGEIQTVTSGNAVFDEVKWVLHDSVGYMFFEPQGNVQIKNQSVTGDWHGPDVNYSVGTTETKDMFLLGKSHGTAPSDDTYSYIMIPNADSTVMTAYEAEMPASVLSNTEVLQAVWHEGLKMVQAAFYEAGSVTLPNGAVLTVSSPCAVMVAFDGNDYEIAISDPEHDALDCTVTLSGSISAEVYFNEPVGDMGNDAGKTYIYSSK